MPIIVQNVSYTYGKGSPFEKLALNNISFTIEDGDFIALIGHTGSGKSTLIQLLNGLIKPDSGSVIVNGHNLCDDKIDMKKIRSTVGIVFQYPEYQLFEETVYKDIAYGPSNLGKTPEEISKIIDDVLPLVGLESDILDKSPFELSGGQKRRVAIAGVLAMEPAVLILDEPTAGLDPAGRNDILSCITALHNKKNTTVILVSHSMEDVANTVDKILVISDANLLAFDSVANVFKDSVALKNIGLNVPQVTRVVNHLKQKGIDLGDDIYTVDSAVDAVVRYLEEGKKC
ncbi:MAG: energy-coupling factor transporter ATPase [Ruminococcaceae bacterium]|nr:energy-coupling factor transporter ATPase [Oscillospiraceae bacterium]